MTLRHTRLVLVVLGTCFAGAALGYSQSTSVEVYLPWLWPTWFALAALACWTFAANLGSSFWWNTSRILVVIGVLSRCGSIITRINRHTITSPWAGFATICLYVAAAGAFHRVWTIDFRYWSRRLAATGER